MMENFYLNIKLFKNNYFNICVLIMSLILSSIIIILINNHQNAKNDLQTYEFHFDIDKTTSEHTDFLYDKYIRGYADSDEWINAVGDFRESRAKFLYHKEINKRFNFVTDPSVIYMMDTEINRSINTNLEGVFFGTRKYVDRFFFTEIANFNEEDIIQEFFVKRNITEKEKIIFRYLMNNFSVKEHSRSSNEVRISYSLDVENRDNEYFVASRYLFHRYINFYFDHQYFMNTAPMFQNRFQNSLKNLDNNIHILREKALIYASLDYESYSKCLNTQLNLAESIYQENPDEEGGRPMYNQLQKEVLLILKHNQSQNFIYYCKENYYLLGPDVLRQLIKESYSLTPELYLKEFIDHLEIFDNAIEKIIYVIDNFELKQNFISETPYMVEYYRTDIFYRGSKMTYITKIIFFITNFLLFSYIFFIVKNIINRKKI